MADKYNKKNNIKNSTEKHHKISDDKQRRIPLYRIIIAGLLLLFVAVNLIPSGYYIVEPGPPLALHELIKVEDSYRQEDWGAFYLTSVGQRRASLWEVFQFILLPGTDDRELSPVEAAVPPGMDEREYINLMANLMEESQLEAQAVALEAAGYEVQIAGQGVEIIDILPDSPAENNLQTGDIITAINGEQIDMATEAVDLISRRDVGEPVELLVSRQNETQQLEISTYENPQREGQPSIGVMITSAKLDYEMPELVSFAESDLVGPSAGVMFALEIYNQLTETDITAGEKIAGSGEIDHKGNISEVAGIKLKLAAAAEESATKFISASANRKELEEHPYSEELEIILAQNFQELLENLSASLD